MSGLPPKGTRYKLVQVHLIVPEGEESYMDLLSDHRDDNPDQMVQWVGEVKLHGLKKDDMELAWKLHTGEDIDIEERE